MKIPDYGGQQVNDRPLQAPKLQTDAPLEAFGGGQSTANAFNAAGNVAGTVEQIAGQEYRKQYQDAVNQQSMVAMNQLLKEETRLKQSMMDMSGPDAQKATGSILGDYERAYQGLEKNLQNDDVRKNVFNHYLDSQGKLGAWAQHVASVKMKQYDAEEFDAEGKTLVDSVGVDPSQQNVVTAAEGRKLAIAQFAARNNLGPEWVKAQQAGQASAIYLTALKSLTQMGDLAAKNFYDMNKADFVGHDAQVAAQLVEANTYRGQAQREVMRIIQGTMNPNEVGAPQAPTEKEAFAEVDKIEDPKLQDMVRDRLRERFTDMKRIEADAQRADIMSAANIIEGNPSLDAIPVDLYERLPLAARRSLQERATQIIRGEGPKPVSDAYLDLVRESAENPDEFTKLNLALYRSKITDSELKELAKDQVGILKGDERTAAKLRGFLTMHDTIKQRLKVIGLDDDETVDEVMRTLNRDYIQYKKQHDGKEPDPSEAEKMVDDLVGSERRWYKLWLGKSPVLKFTVYDDIPESDRTAIEKALKESGQVVTKGRVEDLYRKKQAK